MKPSRILSWTAVPLMAAALVCPHAASAQCETDSRWQRAELNIGSVPAPIVDNVGQLADEVEFAALGASGTAVQFRAGGVDLIMVDDLARVSFSPEHTDGLATLTPGGQLGGQVTLAGSSIGGVVLPAWEDLVASHLWGDAVGRYRATGRTWRAVWSGPATDLDRMAFRVEGIAEATADPVSGELRMTLAVNPDRELTLYPAKAWVGEEATHLPFVLSDEGIVSLGAPVPEGATVEMLLVFAPYTHVVDAVADGRGGLVGIGSTRDAYGAENGPSGRDVVIVRTDASGREWLGSTVLASSGEDSASGVTAMDGETWIVGSAGAADFPVATKGKGVAYPAPFAARLNADGALVAGSALRRHGVETASDLALDAEGRLFVAGTATASAETTEGIDLTAVLPVDDSAPPVVYSVVELTADLDRAPRVQTFVSHVGASLDVRPACDGQLSVGLPSAASATVGNCLPRHSKHIYTPVLPSPGLWWFHSDPEVNSVNPYPLYDRWGYHALRWKEYYGNWLGPATPVVYDVMAAASPLTPAVPIQQVAFLDHLRLDALEADALVFPNGDPAGSWLRNDAWNYLELAIGAAAYAEFWNSPTYANLRYDTGTATGPGFITGAVAITETEWCSHDRLSTQGNPGPGGKGPVQLCREEANCGGPNCKFPIDTWDDVCANSPFYDPNASPTASAEVYLNRFEYSHWDGAYTEGETEGYWQDVRTRFDQAIPNRYYVADPPAAVDRAQSLVAEGVQRELARVVEDVPVTITTIIDGEIESAKAGTGFQRAATRLANPR